MRYVDSLTTDSGFPGGTTISYTGIEYLEISLSDILVFIGQCVSPFAYSELLYVNKNQVMILCLSSSRISFIRLPAISHFSFCRNRPDGMCRDYRCSKRQYRAEAKSARFRDQVTQVTQNTAFPGTVQQVLTKNTDRPLSILQSSDISIRLSFPYPIVCMDLCLSGCRIKKYRYFLLYNLPSPILLSHGFPPSSRYWTVALPQGRGRFIGSCTRWILQGLKVMQ